MRLLTAILMITVSFCNIYSQSILLHTNDAKVWKQDQVISGRLTGFFASSGNLFLNGSMIPFDVSSSDSSFTVNITIPEGESSFFAEAGGYQSDTVRFTLGYELRPDVYAYADVSGQDITLHGTILTNPGNPSLSYKWEADENNPGTISLSGVNDTTVTFTLPGNSPLGEYYFSFNVYTSNGDTVKAETFITNYQDSIRVFHIKDDHAAWIDSAVIYEITPYTFVINGNFNDIINKIPDLVRLGINTI